jgi:hypothetical protein
MDVRGSRNGEQSLENGVDVLGSEHFFKGKTML